MFAQAHGVRDRNSPARPLDQIALTGTTGPIASERTTAMGQLDGQVAFITGLARGQGRSHALTLAREGADIIGLDLCGEIASTTYPGSSPADLEETERLLKETGRQAVLSQADVRDYEQVQAAFARGLEQL